ncbi:MAG: hypothetical protein NTY59_12970 [Alphaproteobacteria bacterium]|nr:hypothetical protein [Alphaproteobacteria bacterium]
MDLREFVSATLRDIAFGIQDAQKIDGVGGLIAPSSIGGHELPADSGVTNNSRITSTVVKFDVAVTAEETAAGGAKAGVKVLGLSAGVGGDLTAKSGTASRVQFSVPLVMPKNNRNWSTEGQAS